MPVDLNLIRKNHAWAENFSDEILLKMIAKNPRFFNVEESPFFIWGEDPITGKVIPAVSRWSQPVIGFAIAAIALVFIMRMK